ncbi:MAG TPA: dihydrolipoamide acetyltransferase family protein [Gaiellaceae bacterium]|nr:dihydrolipoamide acetyltransferase family protein [Gaiellaceae bacterium]
MATEVRLPRLGQGMEAGTIVRWLKSKGDPVTKGEPLYELDTDKVTQEVEAEADGVLLEIVVTEGEVDVGTTVAVIGAEGEDVSDLLAAASGGNGGGLTAPPSDAAEGKSPPSGSEPQGAVPAEGAPADEAEAPADAAAQVAEEPSGSEPQSVVEPEAEPAPARAPGERMKASPLARRMARERGIDLAAIAGTGPDGRIVADDVDQAATAPAPAPAPDVAPSAPSAPGEVEVVELTSVRRTIARRLTEAWQAPVFQLTVTADASELLVTREQMVERLREGETKPTVSDVLTRLVAAALIRHRAVNAHFVDGRIHRHPTANVGIAVATLSGLMVPVVRSAERKSVQEIADVRADLVSRAREGKLQLADLEEGTFTVSNLGMYGIDQFIAVLNPPQVAILAVGSIEDRAHAVEGELVVRPTLTMTLTCDHRAIDGSEGAEFLRTVNELVEAPALAL